MSTGVICRMQNPYSHSNPSLHLVLCDHISLPEFRGVPLIGVHDVFQVLHSIPHIHKACIQRCESKAQGGWWPVVPNYASLDKGLPTSSKFDLNRVLRVQRLL